jgi:non-specific serine/threonine protein kinase
MPSVPRRGRSSLAAIALVGIALAGCSSGSDEPSAQPTTTTSTTLASTTTTTAAPLPSAQQAEPSLPAPVQESAAAVTTTRLYVAGGFDANRESVANVSVFDGTSWGSAPSLPLALNHPSAAAIGDDVYVAGGFNNGTATNRTFVLHEGAAAWEELPPLNVARGAAALVLVADALYVMGGNAGSTQIADVERFDPSAQTWTVVTHLPYPRNHLAGYFDDGRACAAGGREPATSGAVDCLDPATLAWTTEILPTPTSGAAAAIVRGTLAVAGGEPSGETSIETNVQLFDAAGWTTQPMLVPRHGTGFALFHGRLWMCGGGTEPGYAATDACTSFG